MSIEIYHNPRCSKSRQALALLSQSGIEPKIKLYLNEPLNSKELLDLFKKTGLQPLEMIRTKETIFKELNLKGKDLNPDEWAKVIIENPKLLERPIIVNGQKAVVARPPEKLLEII